MSAPVELALVIPALEDEALLEANLPPLLAELAAVAPEAELILVDDTGRSALLPFAATFAPEATYLARRENGGFARALADGIEAARAPWVLCLNPDVAVHPGFLAPLLARAAEPGVGAVVPRILLDGERGRIESLIGLVFEDGILRLDQPGLAGAPCPDHAVPVAFPIGGACLLERAAFLELGGFDPLFEPFYLEDADLGLCLWRSGRRVLFEPRSVVEHHHRGTIGRVAPAPLADVAIARNLLLLAWKHLGPAELETHLAALGRRLVEASGTSDRAELEALALALERRAAVGVARVDAGPPLAEILGRFESS